MARTDSLEIEGIKELFDSGSEYLAPGISTEEYWSWFIKALDLPTTRLIVLRKEEKPVAVAWCELMPTKDLLVHYIYARDGHGRKLMDALERLAKKENCQRITGVTRRDSNFTQKVFVGKYGYEIVGYWVAKEIK